ncbi:hypothetical protein BDV96DRAFT_644437 [Lophiotrema nucula]|uniref:Uncharacterized protein n=1 Tax=Lophiotrema nucula TaxID=690887 RepID=A0A6A5ZE45_9PLEO|nr:hypothetical protein BDV96DRAFT_644437 [Lophiotrema nucula]
MAPRAGIPSAIDFSALANSAPHTSPFKKRELTVVGIVWVVILSLTAVSILFCIVIGIIICNNKAKARQRQQKMNASRNVDSQSQGKGKYVALEDMEPGGLHEMPTNSGVKGTGVELEGEGNEVPRVQQLDGFTAPPRVNSRPIELPPDAYAGRVG